MSSSSENDNSSNCGSNCGSDCSTNCDSLDVQVPSPSVAWIHFDDEVANIDPQLPVGEKIARLVQLCLAATVTIVEEEVSGTLIADAVSKMGAEMRRRNYRLSEATMAKVTGLVDKLMEENEAVEVVPPRVKVTRDYIASFEREIEEWKKLLKDRKEDYKSARSLKKAVMQNKKKIELSEMNAVNTSDEDACMERLLQQERDFVLRQREVQVGMESAKKRLDEVTKEADVAVEKMERLKGSEI